MRLDNEFIDQESGFFSVKEWMYDDKIQSAIHDREYSEDPETEEYTSQNRETILEWYPFAPHSRLLELGGAYGSLTGLFLRRCGNVTVVENNERHSDIIRDRWRELDGLKVINSNPVLFESQDKYDYIVVHEIWGYVRKLDKNKNAYIDFVKRVKRMLKPDGHLIVVADNRFGLKYFSGSLDEYTKKLFVGVDGYKNYSFVETMSLAQIRELLKECNAGDAKVYYTVSDWHYANRVYTDHTINSIHLVLDKVSGYNRFALFDLEGVYSELQKNLVADAFSDAFIIDVGNGNDYSLVYYQGKEDGSDSFGIFLENGKYVKKVFSDDEFFDENTMLILSDLEGLASDNRINKSEKVYLFPYVDEVDILSQGYIKSMDEQTNKQLNDQLVKEKRIIKEFIESEFEKRNATTIY